MNPLMQISEVSLKVCFVGRPGQSINPRGGVAFDGEERHPRAVDADVVEERSELLLLPLRGLGKARFWIKTRRPPAVVFRLGLALLGSSACRERRLLTGPKRTVQATFLSSSLN